MMVIIMCGGVYDTFKEHKALSKINGERLVNRTIRLLRKNGISEIYISSNDPRFDECDALRLQHDNSFKFENGIIKGYWVDAYYPTNEPCIYLHGDVYYSEDAIKKIINLKPTVNTMIGNQYALNKEHKKVGEPFGWIIVDQYKFRDAINKCKKLQDKKLIDRGYAISWEVYEVLNGHDVNDFIIDEETYLVIADETDDVDTPEKIDILNKKVSDK